MDAAAAERNAASVQSASRPFFIGRLNRTIAFLAIQPGDGGRPRRLLPDRGAPRVSVPLGQGSMFHNDSLYNNQINRFRNVAPKGRG